MSFSAADAAFEGFRVTRRHPVAVLAWAAVMLAATVLSGLAVDTIAGEAWTKFEALAADPMPDPAVVAALMPKVFPAAIASVLIQIVAAGVVNASVLRALLRPERSATLRVGRDEARVIGVMLLFVLVNFAAGGLLSVVLTVASTVISAGLAKLVYFVASIVVLMVLTIRLALAGPMTIAEHRLRFWQSWRETRGWFWPLLGAELLALAMAGVVAFLALVVFVCLAGAFIAATGGDVIGDFAAMFTPTIDKLFTPLPLIYLTFISVVFALILVLLVAPPVELYRALKGGVADADPPQD
jgi:hypothetical protein